MAACCYIIWSDSLQKFYVGACHDSLPDRIQKHNSGFYDGKHFTKKASDWQLFLMIDAIDFADALRIEKKIKSMKSAKYINNLVKYPELLNKLKDISNR